MVITPGRGYHLTQQVRCVWRKKRYVWCKTLGFGVKTIRLAQKKGTFGVKKRKARIGRNPKTGDPVTVPEKNIPFFKMGKGMRERINE